MSTARIKAVSEDFQSRPGVASAPASGTPWPPMAHASNPSLAGPDGPHDEGRSNPVGVQLADVRMAPLVIKNEGGDRCCVTRGLDPRTIRRWETRLSPDWPPKA